MEIYGYFIFSISLSLSLCSKKLVNRRKRREKERGKRLKKLLGCLEGPSLLTLQAERRRLKKSCGKRKKNLKRNWQKKNNQGRIEMTVVPARRDTEREAGTEQERGNNLFHNL